MFNQIQAIYRDKIIEDVQEINSFSYYYFYKDHSFQSVFAIEKSISVEEYQLLKTTFIEKKVYAITKKEQQLYEYLLENALYPLKTETTFLIYFVSEEDEATINGVLKDIYPETLFIKYLNYTIALGKHFEQVDTLFMTLSDDIGYPIHLHQGFLLSSKTKGSDVITYIDFYSKHLAGLSYSKVTDSIIFSNNQYPEIIKIIQENNLRGILSQPQLLEIISVFLKNNLNVSFTAKLLYMHRNSLISKIEQIEKLTTFNIQNFMDAYVMKIMLDYIHQKHQ